MLCCCWVIVGIMIWYHNEQHFELSDIVITRDNCILKDPHNSHQTVPSTYCYVSCHNGHKHPAFEYCYGLIRPPHCAIYAIEEHISSSFENIFVRSLIQFIITESSSSYDVNFNLHSFLFPSSSYISFPCVNLRSNQLIFVHNASI